MTRDSRLTRMIHVLVHMAGHDGMASSEVIARMLGTNPVVVRRTMGLLRDAGLVRSVVGPGGGWRLVRPLHEITLLAVYRALRPASVFTIDAGAATSACKVEQAANASVAAALDAAARTLDAVLAETTLADVGESAGLPVCAAAD